MWLTFLGKHLVHRGQGSFPVPLFFGELSAAGFGDGIELGAAAAFQLVPLAFNPTFFGKPVEGWEQGTWADNKSTVSDLLNAIGNADAMHRPQIQRTKD